MIATEPMISQPTWSFVRPISARTTVISGAIPNQAKKQRKNANHDRWNARICGVVRSNRLIRVALPSCRISAQPSTWRKMVVVRFGVSSRSAGASALTRTAQPL